MLLDVTPFSLGVRTAGSLHRILIPKNSTIPTEASHIFTTVTDGQRSVRIQVLQGEEKKATQNTLLGEFTLTDIPEAKAGDPEIEVKFSIDSNGILEVSAKDLKTNREQSIVVTARSTLTEEEKTDLLRVSDSELAASK